ncbi:MAG TPA: thioredoxin domain-containing protein [Bacteroidia bacterium]|nr:thioredoxin domain-containing protein [Bacteroidia bacterium]
MKKFIFLFPVFAFLVSCTSSSSMAGGSVPAGRFSVLIDSLAGVQLIDVRTPGEFNSGHISGAQNIDWNGSGFSDGAMALDKSKPVLVYCLSGGRSHEAAEFFRKNGFKTVYELENGLRSWSMANLPLTQETGQQSTASPAFTTGDFSKTVNSGLLVLVDFSATWCRPCQMLKPTIETIEAERKGSLTVLKLDADRDSQLADSLRITALPTLMIFNNGKMTWRNEGLVPKDLIDSKLDEAKK